jgi:AMP-binding enzyme C-terminal domain/Phosphopantetheine attachment site
VGKAYLTGDIGRITPHGQLEWLARKDDQIKFRGFRIELGDIEQNLLRVPGVREAAVIVRDGSLIGYVSTSQPWRETDIQAMLREQIPEAMIPSRIVELKELPRLRNDKIDKRALQAKETADPPFEPPVHRLGTGAGGDLGRCPPTKAAFGDGEFSTYGGHSLGAAMIVARIRKDLGVNIPLSTMLVARTVRSLAAEITKGTSSSKGTSSLALFIPLKQATGLAAPWLLFVPSIGAHPFFSRIWQRASTLLLTGFACREPNPMKSLSAQSKGWPNASLKNSINATFLLSPWLGTRPVESSPLSFAVSSQRGGGRPFISFSSTLWPQGIQESIHFVSAFTYMQQLFLPSAARRRSPIWANAGRVFGSDGICASRESNPLSRK